jgi:transposase
MRGNAEDPRALALGAAFRISKPLIDDELWAVIEPVLPGPKPRRFRVPGRKPIDNRRALTGILFVSKTGIGWEDLPQEMGCGSGKLSVSERLSDPDFITLRTLRHQLVAAGFIEERSRGRLAYSSTWRAGSAAIGAV